MPDKRKYILKEHRRLLYLGTSVLCVFSVASLQETSCPKWLNYMVWGAAFLSDLWQGSAYG